MALEDTGLVLSRPLGVCPRHNAAHISVDGLPVCLRCQAEAAKAQARPVGVVTIADPGHDAMQGLKTAKTERFPDGSVAATEVKPTQARVPTPRPVVPAGGSFAEQVERALVALRACPMPKDLKQFKAVAKAVAILEKLIAPAEEN